MNIDPNWHISPQDGLCSLRLVLVRHGEVTEDVRGRCYGHLEVGLSKLGRSQIQSRIGLLRHLVPAALYTSSSRRALESAAEAAKDLQLVPRAVSALREINFGALEGLSYEEIESRYPHEFEQWMECPTEVKFPGGESFMEMKDRALGFLSVLLGRHTGETVLVISHAGVNRAILADALGLSGKNIFRIDQGYAAVNIIDYFPNRAVVRLVNG